MPNDPRSDEREPVILIVDDHPDTADLLTELLRFHDVHALRAENVAEARDILAHRERVDVVVTDYAMPGEDGLAFLRSLRESETWSALPVVMVSGQDRDGHVARAARQQGASFVPKPFDLDLLVKAVREALARAGAELPAVVDHRDEPTEPERAAHSTVPAPAGRVDVVEIPSSKPDPRRDPDG